MRSPVDAGLFYLILSLVFFLFKSIFAIVSSLNGFFLTLFREAGEWILSSDFLSRVALFFNSKFEFTFSAAKAMMLSSSFNILEFVIVLIVFSFAGFCFGYSYSGRRSYCFVCIIKFSNTYKGKKNK